MVGAVSLLLGRFASYALLTPRCSCAAQSCATSANIEWVGLEPSGEQVVYRTFAGPFLNLRIDKTLPFGLSIPVRFRVHRTLLDDRLPDILRKAFRSLLLYCGSALQPRVAP